jgi:predicted nucleotidyltransferase
VGRPGESGQTIALRLQCWLPAAVSFDLPNCCFFRLGLTTIPEVPADTCVLATGAQQPAKLEWQDHELPWYRANMRIGSPSLRLHNEIVELTQLLRPTDQEDEQRMEARRLLASIVTEVFPGSKLEIFGSFATGLHLPTSDVDCVILQSEVPESQVPTALQGLGRKLQQQTWVTDLEVCSTAVRVA